MPWLHAYEPGSDNLGMDEAETSQGEDHKQRKQNITVPLRFWVNDTYIGRRWSS